jgi:hypothetical protein
MKKILWVFFLAVALISCKKINDNYPDNPDWLNDQIAQMESVDYYFGSKIFLYEWHNSWYYWISIPISSCMMCEFYDYQGEKQVWTQNDIDDFQKNAVRKRIIWQRDPFFF